MDPFSLPSDMVKEIFNVANEQEKVLLLQSFPEALSDYASRVFRSSLEDLVETRGFTLPDSLDWIFLYSLIFSPTYDAYLSLMTKNRTEYYSVLATQIPISDIVKPSQEDIEKLFVHSVTTLSVNGYDLLSFLFHSLTEDRHAMISKSFEILTSSRKFDLCKEFLRNYANGSKIEDWQKATRKVFDKNVPMLEVLILFKPAHGLGCDDLDFFTKGLNIKNQIILDYGLNSPPINTDLGKLLRHHYRNSKTEGEGRLFGYFAGINRAMRNRIGDKVSYVSELFLSSILKRKDKEFFALALEVLDRVYGPNRSFEFVIRYYLNIHSSESIPEIQEKFQPCLVGIDIEYLTFAPKSEREKQFLAL